MRAGWLVTLLVVAGCRTLLGLEEPTVVDSGGDVAELSFELADTTTDEASGMVNVAVVLAAAVDHEVSVAVSAAAGSALEGVDFAFATTTVTFAAGESRKLVAVTIMTDADETELTETFQLVLSSPVGASIGATGTHTVTISDVILPRVQVAAETTSTPESAQTQLAVTLDKAAAADVTVVVGVAGATPGVDYTIADGTVITVLAGATAAMVPIGELADALDEVDEVVTFTLGSPSANALVGASASTKHTIVDDDPEPSVGFTVAASTVGEAAATQLVGVTLSAPSGKTVEVDFAATGGNASAADASVTAGTLVFAPGETTKLFVVSITNDVIDESNETVIVSLSNPQDAILASASHTITIADDDDAPSAAFDPAQPDRSVVEGDTGTTTFTYDVVLSVPSGLTITVPILFSGDAVQPGDFSVQGVPVVFGPGDTRKAFQYIVVGDTVNETGASDVIIMTVGVPTNAVAGADDERSHTIFDDD